MGSDKMIAVQLYERDGKEGAIWLPLARLHSEDGGIDVESAASTDMTIYDVPANKMFHVDVIVVNCPQTTNALHVFGSDSGNVRKFPPIHCAQSDTTALTGIKGLKFSESEYVYGMLEVAATAWAFAGGHLRDISPRVASSA